MTSSLPAKAASPALPRLLPALGQHAIANCHRLICVCVLLIVMAAPALAQNISYGGRRRFRWPQRQCRSGHGGTIEQARCGSKLRRGQSVHRAHRRPPNSRLDAWMGAGSGTKLKSHNVYRVIVALFVLISVVLVFGHMLTAHNELLVSGGQQMAAGVVAGLGIGWRRPSCAWQAAIRRQLFKSMPGSSVQEATRVQQRLAVCLI